MSVVLDLTITSKSMTSYSGQSLISTILNTIVSPQHTYFYQVLYFFNKPYRENACKRHGISYADVRLRDHKYCHLYQTGCSITHISCKCFVCKLCMFKIRCTRVIRYPSVTGTFCTPCSKHCQYNRIILVIKSFYFTYVLL